MSKRKLEALQHPAPGSVNINDENNFRELISWLEDQKIRNYKIEDRKQLKDIGSKSWSQAFEVYINSLHCPVKAKDRHGVADWLLTLAVNLEYNDNVEKFSEETAEKVTNRRNAPPTVVNTNPLDALDFNSSEFVEGVNKLAKMLKIEPHPDHLVTLNAISYLICARLNQDALQRPGEVIPKGKPFPLKSSDLGFETGDQVLNEAGKLLRLLYIHDLRELQTKINECIVKCQEVTANPKTDTRLGKVGR